MRGKLKKISWEKGEKNDSNLNDVVKLKDEQGDFFVKKVLRKKTLGDAHPETILGSPRNSVAEWNALNPGFLAEIYEDGWIAPFIGGKISTQKEVFQKQLALFNGLSDCKRKHMLDACVTGNLKTVDGQVVFLDPGQVLCFDLQPREKKENNLSFQYWKLAKKAQDGNLKLEIRKCNQPDQSASESFQYNPSETAQLANTTAALLYLQFAYPDIKNADFLNTQPDLIPILANAYLEKKFFKLEIPLVPTSLIDFFTYYPELGKLALSADEKNKNEAALRELMLREQFVESHIETFLKLKKLNCSTDKTLKCLSLVDCDQLDVLVKMGFDALDKAEHLDSFLAQWEKDSNFYDFFSIILQNPEIKFSDDVKNNFWCLLNKFPNINFQTVYYVATSFLDVAPLTINCLPATIGAQELVALSIIQSLNQHHVKAINFLHINQKFSWENACIIVNEFSKTNNLKDIYANNFPEIALEKIDNPAVRKEILEKYKFDDTKLIEIIQKTSKSNVFEAIQNYKKENCFLLTPVFQGRKKFFTEKEKIIKGLDEYLKSRVIKMHFYNSDKLTAEKSTQARALKKIVEESNSLISIIEALMTASVANKKSVDQANVTRPSLFKHSLGEYETKYISEFLDKISLPSFEQIKTYFIEKKVTLPADTDNRDTLYKKLDALKKGVRDEAAKKTIQALMDVAMIKDNPLAFPKTSRYSKLALQHESETQATPRRGR